MRTDDFDYILPPDLIAQTPADRREMSRLMVLNRAIGSITHDHFCNIGSYLRGGDLLVANRSKVIPARLAARKQTGGEVEILLVRRLEDNRWSAMAKPARRLRIGTILSVPGSSLWIQLEDRLDDVLWRIHVQGTPDIDAELQRVGIIPLPPYIHPSGVPLDRYQTVYADRRGSIAAPTAGLHFSRQLLDDLAARAIECAFVTLHVGPGTFRPVKTANVEGHTMDAEWGEIDGATALAINRTRESGGRLVAVGTTTTRLLETAGDAGHLEAWHGETDRFIYPGYTFRVVQALVTNFHLPRSTLLMLVSAFAGRERIMAAYEEAIRLRYRFYSFGDAMLIV